MVPSYKGLFSHDSFMMLLFLHVCMYIVYNNENKTGKLSNSMDKIFASL